MKPVIFFLLACWAGVQALGQKSFRLSADTYTGSLKQATDIMVNDVTSPVAAARYYAYISLAANETAALYQAGQPRFAGRLKGLAPIAVNSQLVKDSDAHLATILALLQTARRLLPSGPLLQRAIDSVRKAALASPALTGRVGASGLVADTVVAQVLRYAAGDGFSRLSGLRRFTPKNGPAYWQPTAPGFMQAVEPHWYTLRPFVLDSCGQFAGLPPAPYSTDTASQFYQLLTEVYGAAKKLEPEQRAIALYWDCNPFALQQVGHLEFGVKKISPGGHWMGIAGIACKQKKLDLAQTAYVHALLAVGMADAFLSCWNNKYKHNRVRPETAIRKLLDPQWRPLLQTPPFPEYTSGHSVVSAAAAAILTHVFGPAFSFTDNTEVEFGLPQRTFSSFRQAADEAAISRLYGGIHFRDAIEQGMLEGTQIGNFVILNSPAFLTKEQASARKPATPPKQREP